MRQDQLNPEQRNLKLAIKKKGIAAIHPDHQFHILFDHLDDISFFAKDRNGKLFASNPTLLKRYNLLEETDIIGKTDYDFVSLGIAEKYRKDDLEVMHNRKPLLNIIELALNAVGVPEWCSTNKFPIVSVNGEVVGVMGTIKSYRFGKLRSSLRPHFQQIIDHISEQYSGNISIKDLANNLNVSVRSFERIFKDMFSMTPQQFIIKTRIFKACDKLREGMGVAETALSCGFYDQSSFTKLFKKQMGLTPLRYIKLYSIR
ncbi:AraC family transcriptional regulator [Paenibacillus agricola]|uniref:AraC family transcriptional regulator n=1 Tax=Paenibacillus agricola TaxID=2716264 RepID=A0ABX0JFQ6_9BACL|nr:AraC family transcriptional regulator [Paenibacillus agricola]NHN33717.1 AraC family transcriptional regulator [Paenibacillus agricola]